MTKYFKTTITVEALSNEELFFEDLADVHYHITEGHASGVWSAVCCEITKEQAHKELVEQGSDETYLDGFDLDNTNECWCSPSGSHEYQVSFEKFGTPVCIYCDGTI